MSTRYSGLAIRSFHHGQQAVAAGDEHRSVTEPVEQPDGVIDACGAFVLKRSRNLHVTDLNLVSRSPVFAHVPGPSITG